MFEHFGKPLLTRAEFLARMVWHGLAAFSIVGSSLGIGVLGYHYFEGLSWLDSLLNASMILGGMGPVDSVHTAGGKIFASCYALFSGIVFLAAVALLFAPAYHRFLHRLHLMDESE
ncbi:MAG TPA: hypothetical protein PLO62_10285 [Candidatus Hydrogenedentes bacterium]|nr:hypothetical protein [Candidatus Hydrogenedentota bacterium]HOS02228.1 hypothetical protein [Candidatus Hydrogenedentota bacterium]